MVDRVVQRLLEHWGTGAIPSQWQKAHVKTLYKKGATDDCNNYRPISLLCVTCKLLASKHSSGAT